GRRRATKAAPRSPTAGTKGRSSAVAESSARSRSVERSAGRAPSIAARASFEARSRPARAAPLRPMPGSEIQLAPSICSTPACTSASLVTTMTSPTASARAAAAIVSRAIARASRGRSVPASSRRVLAAWVVFTGMMTLQSMGSLRGRIGQALGYRGAELWQDIAAVQLEEIGLVVPRIVEDEMGETEIEVALDLGHVLVGIVRDDEPA